MTPIPLSHLSPDMIDKILCQNGRKYGFPKLLLKAVAIIESNLDERAYRFEPNFWDRYLKDNPEWKDKKPEEVSASYGLFQVMYVVAVEMGFKGTPLELYDPFNNIDIGARNLRSRLNKIMLDPKLSLDYRQDPIRCLMTMLAQFNGGRGGNPDDKGILRNGEYAKKVWKKYCELVLSEKSCDE